jgi:hypothetical protein
MLLLAADAAAARKSECDWSLSQDDFKWTEEEKAKLIR